MRLTQLELTDFRNIAGAGFAPDERLTVLCGANGQGKTNLLEAVWLLTGGKSFRAGKDSELIRRGQPFAVLKAAFESGGRPQTLRLTVGDKNGPRPGRQASLNGAAPVRAAEVAGIFTAVVFEPDHLRLVKDGPAGRRRFLDAALCQCRPAHVGQLRRYHRVLAQKNALLKAYEITPGAALLLDTFNAALAESGGAVMAQRAAFLEKLAPLAAAYYAELSHGAERLCLRYCPCAEAGADAAAALAAKLETVRAAELRAGFALTGPHREDIEITLDGAPGRVYGSQGQQRSAVLAMKLAEADVLAEWLGDAPVLLLDDVLSELDEERQAYLLNHIGGRQTIVTTCDSAAFTRTSGRLVTVQAGAITERA